MTFDVKFGIHSSPKKDEELNGDSYYIGKDNGYFIGAIADGLGHGVYANDASKSAIEYIKKNAQVPIEDLILGCHRAIRGTRGVALSVIKILLSENKFQFAGVGNVDCKVHSKDNYHPITVPGIVGYNLRKVRSFSYNINLEDIICLYSDGISSKFELKSFMDLDAQEMADAIYEYFGNEKDDSTIMVLKFV